MVVVLIRLVEPGLNERVLLSQSLGRTTDQPDSLLFFFHSTCTFGVGDQTTQLFFVYSKAFYTIVCVCVIGDYGFKFISLLLYIVHMPKIFVGP